MPIVNAHSTPSLAAGPSLAAAELAQLGGALPAVVVGTGTTAVSLGTVQPEGKAAMPAVDWARGARLTAEDRFV